jgi:hypothetical protein
VEFVLCGGRIFSGPCFFCSNTPKPSRSAISSRNGYGRDDFHVVPCSIRYRSQERIGQNCSRFAPLNRIALVGRAIPCAPSFALQKIVVAAVGAQRTARPTFRFMESFNLQHWTRIGAMNTFLRRKPKRQRTGAVQDLAEGRKHVALACVLECGSPLPLSDEGFMESFHDSMIAHRCHEPDSLHKPLECAGRAQRRLRFSVERGA